MNKFNFSILVIAVLLGKMTELNAQSYTISTVAGNGITGYSGNGGQATAAEINYPGGIFADGSGNIYFSDSHNQRVRKINTSGIITLIAGTGSAGNGGLGGPATAAQLNYPYQLAVDKLGNVFITDWFNNVLKMVNTSGIISIAAGTGTGSFSGDGGQATSADLNLPSGIALDNSGNKYLCDDNNNRIRMIDNSGIISTIGGDGYQSGFGYPGRGGYTGDGGPATAAELHWPSNISTNNAGNVFISDQMNHSIRMINSSGIISTVAGNGVLGYYGDGGPATAAELDNVCGVAVDQSGNIFIADMYNNRIRMVNTSGIISTIAGNGIQSFSGDGGPATAAELNTPLQLNMDASGNIYFCDAANYRIRKLTPHNFETGTGKLISNSEKVIVFPNPNNGIFTIALSRAELVLGSPPIVEIYNLLAEKVYTETLRSTQGDNLIDIGNKANGVYLYRVLDENGNVISNGKFVIEK